MSAPRTNIEKQLRQHRGPIIGMAVILLVVLLGFVWWLADETDDPQMPGDTPVEEMTTPATPAPPADATTAPAPEAGTEPAPATTGG